MAAVKHWIETEVEEVPHKDAFIWEEKLYCMGKFLLHVFLWGRPSSLSLRAFSPETMREPQKKNLQETRTKTPTTLKQKDKLPT